MAEVLVTGASSGIGAGIVEVLAEAGWQVHAMARRADRLADLAARTGCSVHACDVTDGAALAAVLQGLAPDAVVLNAGRGTGFSGIARTSREDMVATVETNVTATLDLIRLVLPGMVARGRGHLVSVGSVSGLYPCPSSVYGGTKAAIRLVADNLRLETRGTGLRVTDIRPGRVTSEFYGVAMPGGSANWTAESGIRELTPHDIAAAVRFALEAPARVNVSAIEVQPLEQSYGGTAFTPVFS